MSVMQPGRSGLALATAVVVAVAVGCGPTFEVIGDGAPATFASRETFDATSDCVSSPDPANGGRPAPPAEVVETGDLPDPAGVVAVTVLGLGDLVVPSGRIVVADVFALVAEPTALVGIDVPGAGGSVPVCLHIARFEPTDERVAFVHLRLGAAAVTRWSEVAAFAVDGGTGGIASPEAVRATGSGFEAVLDQYLEVLDRHSARTWSWLHIATDPETGANVMGFSTGFGDGVYPVVAGYDAAGHLVSLVIDHAILPWRWLSSIGPV